jgi:anti-sigma factor RsiW
MKQKFLKSIVSKQLKQRNMNCKDARNKMIFYAEGELKNPERDQLVQHLTTCSQCALLYQQLDNTLNLADKRETLEPNPFLYTRIREKLDAIEQGFKETAGVPAYQKILRPLALTLVLFLGLYAGNRLGNFYDTKQQEQLTTSLTTEFFINDMEQEKLEVLLLNDE